MKKHVIGLLLIVIATLYSNTGLVIEVIRAKSVSVYGANLLTLSLEDGRQVTWNGLFKLVFGGK